MEHGEIFLTSGERRQRITRAILIWTNFAVISVLGGDLVRAAGGSWTACL